MRCASLLFVCLVPFAGAAELDQTKLGAIKPRFQQFVDEGHIAGAVVAVGSADGIAYLEAVGSSRLGAEPMPKGALFRIASMTKPMTAVAVMMLADEGKLSVDDPVEKHLPDFKGQLLVERRDKDRLVLKRPSRAITLRDLLTHTSGLPVYPPSMVDVYSRRNRTLAETTLAVSQRPLDFAPGSRWSYCNSGIDTLGRVVEVTSGMSYEDFMVKRLFGPLGMKDSTFRPTKEQRQRVPCLYGSKNGKLTLVPDTLLGDPVAPKHPVPAGGLYSTAADVASFYRLMLNEGTVGGKRLLSKKAVAEMTQVQTGDLKCGFVEGMSFGYGFAVVRKPEGVTAMLSPGSFGHGGAFATQSWADPKKGIFMILMIQRTGLPNGDASEMRRELQRLAVAAVK